MVAVSEEEASALDQTDKAKHNSSRIVKLTDGSDDGATTATKSSVKVTATGVASGSIVPAAHI